jgi:hypothetical protein
VKPKLQKTGPKTARYRPPLMESEDEHEAMQLEGKLALTLNQTHTHTASDEARVDLPKRLGKLPEEHQLKPPTDDGKFLQDGCLVITNKMAGSEEIQDDNFSNSGSDDIDQYQDDDNADLLAHNTQQLRAALQMEVRFRQLICYNLKLTTIQRPQVLETTSRNAAAQHHAISDNETEATEPNDDDLGFKDGLTLLKKRGSSARKAAYDREVHLFIIHRCYLTQ